jgi:hypothetical protein
MVSQRRSTRDWRSGSAEGDKAAASAPSVLVPGATTLWIASETDTFTGRIGGPPVTVSNPLPPYPADMGIPTTPGHYTALELFGFAPPPGVSFQVHVVQIPGR